MHADEADVTEEDWRDCNAPFGDPDRSALRNWACAHALYTEAT